VKFSNDISKRLYLSDLPYRFRKFVADRARWL
jgi:hypothetical protein